MRFIPALICLFATNYCFATNITASYHKRSCQYISDKYSRITIASPIRTGSTLLFNVLRFLFEESDILDKELKGAKLQQFPNQVVFKVHPPFAWNEDECFICPVRNPIDTILSAIRIFLPAPHIPISLTQIDHAIAAHLEEMQFLSHFRKNRNNVHILYYEQFVDNFDALFQEIEQIFAITICLEDKNLISEILNKKNIQNEIASFDNFYTFDAKSHFHGKHIETNEFTEREKIHVKRAIYHKLLQQDTSMIKEFGYMTP